MPSETGGFSYDVCFSFAGEDRSYVRAVADCLSRFGVRVFYDEYEEITLWGKNLYEHLDDVYRNVSRYCVIFVSQHYAQRLWTNHERQSAQCRAFKENREYILPARFGDTPLPGLRDTVAYVDLLHKTPESFSKLILQKLGIPEKEPPISDARSRRSLLVIDDDFPVISDLFAPLLDSGFTICGARSVSEALDIIYSDQEIAVVLCDLMLPYGFEVAGDPRHGGIEVMEALRRVRPEAKVFCFSVVGREEILARVQGLGVRDFIRKPIRPSEFKARIMAALESPSDSERQELTNFELGRWLAALKDKGYQGANSYSMGVRRALR
ncbi:MAG: TIR domain-containing protein [Terriglobia bacterium]|jgi:CheY-like chemotaxis protein